MTAWSKASQTVDSYGQMSILSNDKHHLGRGTPSNEHYLTYSPYMTWHATCSQYMTSYMYPLHYTCYVSTALGWRCEWLHFLHGCFKSRNVASGTWRGRNTRTSTPLTTGWMFQKVIIFLWKWSRCRVNIQAAGKRRVIVMAMIVCNIDRILEA